MHADFAALGPVVAERAPGGLRGILFDLGVSSMQIDRAERGFSYLREGPLDMRMNPEATETAAELLARIDRDGLRALLAAGGEVKRPGRIASSILAAREAGELHGTGDLRRAVERVVGHHDSLGELSRVFQALRIAVNGELAQLDALLAALPDLLAPGGVAVALSYHSLEDRRVKQAFRLGSRGCICPPELPLCACGHTAVYTPLTPRPGRATAAEIARNPRARSARLRAVRRLATC